MHAQGVQMNQARPCLADGHDALRALQLEMRPQAPHVLDGWHRTLQLTVLEPDGQGLGQCEAAVGEEIREKSGRLQWALWPGPVDKALGKLADLASASAPFNETYARCTQLGKALSAWRTSIGNNRPVIPDDGQR